MSLKKRKHQWLAATTCIKNTCKVECIKQLDKSFSVHVLLLNSKKLAPVQWSTAVSPSQISFQGFSGVLSFGCWPLNNRIADCVNWGGCDGEHTSLFDRERIRQYYLVHALQNSQNIFDCRAVRESRPSIHDHLPHLEMSLHDGGVLRVPPIPCNNRKCSTQVLVKLSAKQVWKESDENNSLQLTDKAISGGACTTLRN